MSLQGDKATSTSLCCWRGQPSPWPLLFAEGVAVSGHTLSSLFNLCNLRNSGQEPHQDLGWVWSQWQEQRVGKLQLRGSRGFSPQPPQLPLLSSMLWDRAVALVLHRVTLPGQGHVCPWEGLSLLAPWAGTAGRAGPDRVKGTQCSRDTLGLVQALKRKHQTKGGWFPLLFLVMFFNLGFRSYFSPPPGVGRAVGKDLEVSTHSVDLWQD